VVESLVVVDSSGAAVVDEVGSLVGGRLSPKLND